MPVTIRNVHFYTLTQKAKLETVHGMTVGFADMVRIADTGMWGECCVWIIWRDFARTDRNVNSCSKCFFLYLLIQKIQCRVALYVFFSPRFELPAPTDNTNQNTNKVKAVLVCHYCNEYGHKAMYCLKMTPEQRAEQARIENEPFFKVCIIPSCTVDPKG